MTTKQLQSQTELYQHLQDHLGFLQASADAYDKGFEGEAKRLSASIRVLVQDTKKCKSLLGQLGQKNILFFDSAFEEVQGNQSTHCGANYIAFLDDIPHGQNRTIDFDTWWNSTVFIDAKGHKLSRKDLVLTVAEQDGGVHVDPSLKQVYADLSRNNSLGWIYSDGKTTQPLEGPALAAIRQIAHELLKSLIPSYTKTPVYPPDGIVMGGAVMLQRNEATARTANLNNRKKVSRNNPCPCGSGKKYKRCCGAIV